jgi:hypothetical protein
MDQSWFIRIETLRGLTPTQIYELMMQEVRAVIEHHIVAKFTLVPKVSSRSGE